MSTGFKKMFGMNQRRSNVVSGSRESVNDNEDDPLALLNQFQTLYSEKLRKIEENSEDPTEEKIKALQEWVNDLSEQNVVLIHTVEELEKQALCRVSRFNTLAQDVKESIYNDVQSDLCQLLELLKRIREGKPYCACGLEFRTISYMDVFGVPPPKKKALPPPDDPCDFSYNDHLDLLIPCLHLSNYTAYRKGKCAEEAKHSPEFAKKVTGIQEAFHKNEIDMAKCMCEIDELSKKLAEKNHECDTLRGKNCRFEQVENELKIRNNEIKCLQEKNSKLVNESAKALERLEELRDQVQQLQNNLQSKTELINSLQGQKQQLACESKAVSQRNEELTCQLNTLKSEANERELLFAKQKMSLLEENTKKDEEVRQLKLNLSQAYSELEEVKQQFFSEKIQKELIEESNQKIRQEMNSIQNSSTPTEESKILKLKICDLETQLNQKQCEVSHLKKENEKKMKCVKSMSEKIDRINHEKTVLQSQVSQNEDFLNDRSFIDESYKSEIIKLRNELNCSLRRIKELEDYINRFEAQLEALETSSVDDSRNEQLNSQISSLSATIMKKDNEIKQLIDEVNSLRMQISRIEHDASDREKRASDMMRQMKCELQNKNAQLEDIKNEVALQNKEAKESLKLLNTSNGNNLAAGDSEITKLKFKLKDTQEALTAEIADKHDEIRRLKDDVKELEEKLLQADQQTQFRDVLIKELRKEAKVGRAKESLAEMLGLKGTPRAAMKSKIENLTGQIEEMKACILSLETRLAECNLPAVLMLRSRLNQAEGSLLAMCNKMDYVRRYLENLKGDEEQSMKCGLEALLNELRDDLEWNRQTRRNLSLDEGTSVIVISHRSRSLPDNSLHRLPGKAQSDSLLASNKSNITHYPLEAFQECKNSIETINELENNFDETTKAIMSTWNSLKLWTKGEGDSISKMFEEVVKSSIEDQDAIEKLASELGSLVEMGNEFGECNLAYLESNLIELGRYLTKVNLMSSSSDSLLGKDCDNSDELATSAKKISMSISDSLSLLYEMKKKSMAQVPSSFKTCLQDLMILLTTILGNRKSCHEKLISLQKQQVEYIQSLVRRVSEFDVGLTTYHNTGENLKTELKKLFSILLVKDNQLHKLIDELQSLKTLLSSRHRGDDNKIEEISNLRKVVSNKDLQLIEKEELIHNLRSLNYTLRRNKLSRSSPSICCSGDLSEELEEKLQQLDENIVAIKGNLSAILIYLVKNQDKMTEFEEDSRSLVRTLAETHQEITSFKDSVTDGQGDSFNVSTLGDKLKEAGVKVEQLLNAVEIFLCDTEKPDLNVISDTLRRKMMKLIYVAEFIKKSALQENSLLKTMTNENEELKRKDASKEDVISNLKESLEQAQSDVEAFHEEYSRLKHQKEEMEFKNQKVMEELQAKISSLQEAASHTRSGPDIVSSKTWLFPWPQNRHSRHGHDV